MVQNNSIQVLLVKEFVFNTRPEQLYPLLNEIIDTIQIQLSTDFTASLEGRCKMIIIELLTNALKHSDTSQSLILLTIDSNRIVISKSDKGRPFYLTAWQNRPAVQWPDTGLAPGDCIVIYEDDMCCLNGLVEPDNTLLFITEDLPVIIPPRPKNLLEHFGLMVLAKSSDRLTYCYDETDGTNVFKASLNLSF